MVEPGGGGCRSVKNNRSLIWNVLLSYPYTLCAGLIMENPARLGPINGIQLDLDLLMVNPSRFGPVNGESS